MLKNRLITLAAITLALSACAPERPESVLEEAGKDVQEAVEEGKKAAHNVADAVDQLRTERLEVAEAEKALQRARQKLKIRRKSLAGEQQDLRAAASDTAIFRLLQKNILDAAELDDLAISVTVLEQHVTLTGDVPASGQRGAAQRIAQAVPGVKSVDNLIVVTGQSKNNE